jgi:hypothetical protein
LEGAARKCVHPEPDHANIWLRSRPQFLREDKTMRNAARKSRRFPPDEGTIAWIDPSVYDDKRNFNPTIAALVTDEALHGCGIVTLSRDEIDPDAECMIPVGDLAPLRSQIRWVKDLDPGVRKVGVMFLE